MSLREIALLLLVILCVDLKNGAEGGVRLLDEEEEEHPNKSIIKTIQTEDGDIFDCIDINLQPSLQHPLLRYHKVQMSPSSSLSNVTNETSSRKSISIGLLGKWCPTATVPIRRTPKKYLKRAKSFHDIQRRPANTVTIVDTELKYRYHEAGAMGLGKYFGTQAVVNIWGPQVSQNQFSSALVGLHNDPQSETIQVGWTVNPGIYGDKLTRLYTGWIAGNKQGCVDLRCPGFVQVSTKIPLGAAIKTVSSFGGPTYEMGVTVSKDPGTGHWWFTIGNEHVGYWPKSLFTGLNDGTSFLRWEGVVYSLSNEQGPPMGSGHLPSEFFDTYKKVCYIKKIKVVDEGYNLIDPDRSVTHGIEDQPKCYMSFFSHGTDEWGSNVDFGGPGNCTI